MYRVLRVGRMEFLFEVSRVPVFHLLFWRFGVWWRWDVRPQHLRLFDVQVFHWFPRREGR